MHHYHAMMTKKQQTTAHLSFGLGSGPGRPLRPGTRGSGGCLKEVGFLGVLDSTTYVQIYLGINHCFPPKKESWMTSLLVYCPRGLFDMTIWFWTQSILLRPEHNCRAAKVDLVLTRVIWVRLHCDHDCDAINLLIYLLGLWWIKEWTLTRRASPVDTGKNSRKKCAPESFVEFWVCGILSQNPTPTLPSETNDWLSSG